MKDTIFFVFGHVVNSFLFGLGMAGLLFHRFSLLYIVMVFTWFLNYVGLEFIRKDY